MLQKWRLLNRPQTPKPRDRGGGTGTFAIRTWGQAPLGATDQAWTGHFPTRARGKWEMRQKDVRGTARSRPRNRRGQGAGEDAPVRTWRRRQVVPRSQYATPKPPQTVRACAAKPPQNIQPPSCPPSTQSPQLCPPTHPSSSVLPPLTPQLHPSHSPPHCPPSTHTLPSLFSLHSEPPQLCPPSAWPATPSPP